MRLLATYFRRFLKHRSRLVLGILSIPLAQSLDVATTILVGQALDRVRTSSDVDWLTTTLLLRGGAALALTGGAWPAKAASPPAFLIK